MGARLLGVSEAAHCSAVYHSLYVYHLIYSGVCHSLLVYTAVYHSMQFTQRCITYYRSM